MAVPGAKRNSVLEEVLKVFCEPCARDGTRVSAFGFCQDCCEHLCPNCFSHHKKATLSMHHTLLDRGGTQESLRPSAKLSPVSWSPDDLKEPCLKHKKKTIEFYCQEHKVVLCNVCVMLEHTGKSCHIDYIPDISGHVVDSQEFKDILEHMDVIIRHCQRVKEESKKVAEKLSTSLTEVLEEIKKYRQEINKRIDELENEVENKAKALRQQEHQKSQTTAKICDDVSKAVKVLSDNIEQSNATKQADKLFIELKNAKVELKEHETCVSELTTNRDAIVYQFKANPAILTILKSETSLGTLEQLIHSTTGQTPLYEYLKKSRGQTILEFQAHQVQQKPSGQTDVQNLQQTIQNKPLQKPQCQVVQSTRNETAQKATSLPLSTLSTKSVEFSHRGKISVKALDGNESCFIITGFTLLQSDQIAFADYKNNSMKIVDVIGETIIFEIRLSSRPWDITSVNGNQLAVTLPDERRIQFLSLSTNMLFLFLALSPYKLSQAHTFNVDGSCHGISYCQSKLVVSYDNPAKLEILDMKGIVLSTVTSYGNGESIFIYPEYVQADSHSVCVSDRGTGKVTMLNWQGHVTGSYEGLGECRGLALSPGGTVFVCDYRKNNIVEISSDCKQGKIVMKDVHKPQTVCCDKGGKFYISSFSFTENDNFIHVFKKS